MSDKFDLKSQKFPFRSNPISIQKNTVHIEQTAKFECGLIQFLNKSIQ